MPQLKQRFQSFEEYLSYDDGTDNLYELFNGELIAVVEIVSPGELQRDRDYVAKRMQYQDRGIPEYWIVDPIQTLISILQLSDGNYQEFATLRGTDSLCSPSLGELDLTADHIFALAE